MDFSRDEVQTELCELARRLFATRVTPDFLRAHAASGAAWDSVLWTQLHEAGLVTAALPPTTGGSGFGLLELGWLLEAAGKVLAPVPLLPTVIGARALAVAAGNSPQAADGIAGARWLHAITGEKRAVLALALADDGDDLLVPSTSAERNSHDQWLLQGDKTAVPYGSEADAVLVSARTPDGPALFVVSGDAAGLHRQSQRSTHGEPWARLTFKDVSLPASAFIGGAEALVRLVGELRAALAAWQVGVAEAALHQTAAYVSARQQFGRPLGSMQAVQQRMADAYIDVEAMRSTSLLANGLLDRIDARPVASGGDSSTLIADTAVAGYWAALGGHRVTHAAQHLHGGMGADVEYPIHRYFLDAKARGLAVGGSQALLAVIGAEIAAGRIRRLSGVES
jgi:3-oxocholest-4-en-26-oyl-CoA dehydrogenase beta subunit